jgi:hypothetical protein
MPTADDHQCDNHTALQHHIREREYAQPTHVVSRDQLWQIPRLLIRSAVANNLVHTEVGVSTVVCVCVCVCVCIDEREDEGEQPCRQFAKRTVQRRKYGEQERHSTVSATTKPCEIHSPPYSSGAVMPSSPWSPSLIQNSRRASKSLSLSMA